MFKLLVVFLSLWLGSLHAESKKPDVVFIIVDDLNDWVGVMGGHPQTITPNFDALADRGMLFTNAHCNAPQCKPSRGSLLSGLYPKSTGVFVNGKVIFHGGKPLPKVKVRKKSIPLNKHFMASGYRVALGGKVYHAGKPAADAYLPLQKIKKPTNAPKFSAFDPPWDGFPMDTADETTGDYKVVEWAKKQWAEKSAKPLFMAVGLYRPHRPLWAPQKYFDKFPTKSIQLPAAPIEDDWNDMPEYAIKIARSHAHKPFHSNGKFSDHEAILNKGGETEWKRVVGSYLANVYFMDTMLGRLLKDLESNPRDRETIIVMTSDHGWNLGEKKHWCKGALWKNTTNVPMVIIAPGISKAKTRSKQPVSLIDVYPTLCDLANIEKPAHLEGKSMVNLVKQTETRKAAFLSYGPENTAMQTERYRYILYADGSEELYDHYKDPHEWTNLASNPEYASMKAEMKKSVEEFLRK